MNAEDFQPEHFLWDFADGIAVITLNRPQRKNPLTFESYAELRDTFRALAQWDEVKAVILTGADGNFCSGGDVHDIIGPLTGRDVKGLLAFARMTGDLVKAMIASPQPVIAAVDGACVGAGAAMAMAADLRFGTPRTKVAFLFTRVGLAGCDMGACALLPRIVGHGRAAELLYTGRTLDSGEALQWGFLNAVNAPEELMSKTRTCAEGLASGPNFAHAITKTMLRQEWNMALDQAIEAEAQAQALCMQTADFRRAYEAFKSRRKPEFRGD